MFYIWKIEQDSDTTLVDTVNVSEILYIYIQFTVLTLLACILYTEWVQVMQNIQTLYERYLRYLFSARN